jgi:FMN phosphatase YigB (HAD superfamily)
MLNRPLRAVLFDIGDTLWHAQSAPSSAEFREMAAARAHEFLTLRGFDGFRADEFARVAWDSIDDAMIAARQTDLVEPNYAAVAADALKASGLAIDVPGAGAFLEAIYVSGADGGKEAYPDAPMVLAELKSRGFLIGSVTNRAFGGERFRSDLRDAGIDQHWDAHTVSVEVGYLKPHEAVFKHALTALKVAPNEALMVGNSLREDIAGAAKLGIYTAWRRSRPDADGVEPDVMFDELSELLDIPQLQVAR